jgi:excisionase family DNA binding protein
VSGTSESAIHEYLTTAEVAGLLRVQPKTIRNKVASGVFRQGLHFFRKPGLGLRWKREAVVAWVESEDVREVDVFPLAQPGGRRRIA